MESIVCDEEHFDLVAFHSEKSDRPSVGVVANMQCDSREDCRTDQLSIEYDIFLGEKIVCGAYRTFPKSGQSIEFGRRGRDEGPDHLRAG